MADITQHEHADDGVNGTHHLDGERAPMPRPRPAVVEHRGTPSAEDRAARAAEDRRLLERYHRSGDRSAREEVVQRFLPLARLVARGFAGEGEPLEDLVQVGSVGLV